MSTDHPRSVWGAVRAMFLRGAVVIVPLALTVWFFIALWRAIDGILSPLFAAWLGREIPGLGFLSMLVLILLVGLLTRNLVGRLLLSWFEGLLRSIPFVRSVYGAIRDLVNAFSLGGKGRTFREVVLLEYPRRDLYTLGFVTNEMTLERPDGAPLRMLNLYIPNPPNPTSGVLILAPEHEVVHLDLTIEQGLKLVLSGGIVTPEQFRARRPAHP